MVCAVDNFEYEIIKGEPVFVVKKFPGRHDVNDAQQLCCFFPRTQMMLPLLKEQIVPALGKTVVDFWNIERVSNQLKQCVAGKCKSCGIEGAGLIVPKQGDNIIIRSVREDNVLEGVVDGVAGHFMMEIDQIEFWSPFFLLD